MAPVKLDFKINGSKKPFYSSRQSKPLRVALSESRAPKTLTLYGKGNIIPPSAKNKHRPGWMCRKHLPATTH